MITKFKKRHLRSWRSYRRWYIKNKEVYGIYVYNGVNQEGLIVLIRESIDKDINHVGNTSQSSR